jgi:hypothetical protein
MTDDPLRLYRVPGTERIADHGQCGPYPWQADYLYRVRSPLGPGAGSHDPGGHVKDSVKEEKQRIGGKTMPKTKQKKKTKSEPVVTGKKKKRK